MGQAQNDVTVGGKLQSVAACLSPATSGLFCPIYNLIFLQYGFNVHANGMATNPTER